MKNDRLTSLFRSAARPEPDPGADDLPSRVLRAVRRDSMEPAPSVFAQLGNLLPRVAVAAAVVVAACLLAEYSASGDLSADVVQLSEQWLFAAN